MWGGRRLHDWLSVVAWAARRPALLEQLFPIPKTRRHLVRQRESELMREHTHLPAMVRFMRNHVAQHFDASRPRLGPAVAEKLFDTTFAIAERVSEHLRAASGALRQGGTGLQQRAVRAVELNWNLQVRRGQPDPLGADIVHVGEDRRDGARVAGRFGIPGRWVKMFDQNLVDSIVGDKDPDGDLAEWPVDFVADLDLTRGQDFCSLTDQNTS